VNARARLRRVDRRT